MEQTTEEQCMVCLNCLREEDALWTCNCCHQKCHMLCTFQWTLRLSLDRSRNVSSFSCPGCRTSHAISTLPGFEQHTAARGQRGSTQTADILRRVFGVAPTTSAARVSDDDEQTVVDEDEDESDDDDDDEDGGEDGGRCLFSVSTEKIYIDVETLNIHINSR